MMDRYFMVLLQSVAFKNKIRSLSEAEVTVIF